MPDRAHLDFEVSYTGSNRFTGFQMARISSLLSSDLFFCLLSCKQERVHCNVPPSLEMQARRPGGMEG